MHFELGTCFTCLEHIGHFRPTCLLHSFTISIPTPGQKSTSKIQETAILNARSLFSYHEHKIF